MYVLDTLYNDLTLTMEKIVIKYTKKATDNETTDSRRDGDRYIAAVQGIDSFNTYSSFDRQAIINAGVTSEDLITTYVSDKTTIPRSLRDAVVAAQRALVIANYVEMNNYYRMLTGLPDTDDYEYIYVDTGTASLLNISATTPIHELSNDDITKLEKNGFLATMRTTYPSKKYLNYLGYNGIDVSTARLAKDFAVLRMNTSVTESFYSEFNTTYEQCREYFMTVLYNKTFGYQYEYYDNFMALMIMIMTIQRIVGNMFKYGIEYDFYDLGSLQMVFDTYSVPFIENLPTDYQKILVKNLNNLLRYKSTDKVLYDICSLLGYERIKIYKYYLIKNHKLDENENPLFVYKNVTDDNGNVTKVEDLAQMYDLYFQAVELSERNVALALADNTSVLDYEQVVVDDPYWWEDDEDLQTALLETDYNFIETKYLSMNIMYKLTQMLFETVYVFRMLIDKKEQLGSITLTLPKLFDVSKEIDLFMVTVFLCALISKKNGMAGNIISTPSKTLSVLGFNFNADFETIRAEIKANPKIYDQDILDYLEGMHVFTAEDVNNLYVNIKNLNDFLVEKIAQAQTLEQYRAYKDLHTALLLTQHMETLFQKNDGTTAETFLEYLNDKDQVLGLFVQEATTDNIGEYIDHVLARLNLKLSDLEYLNILNDSNSVVLNAVITLIKFFKSYTTDMTSFSVLYMMDSRYYNMLKLVHHIKNAEAMIYPRDTSMQVHYKSTMKGYTSSLTNKETLNSTNYLSFTNSMRTNRNTADKMTNYDKIKSITYDYS